MTNIKDYKNEKMMSRLDELSLRKDEIISEIDRDAIRRHNGAKEKLDTMACLGYMAELGSMCREAKEMAKKLKGE